MPAMVVIGLALGSCKVRKSLKYTSEGVLTRVKVGQIRQNNLILININASSLLRFRGFLTSD